VVAVSLVLAFAGGQIVRAVRELRRLTARIEQYADLPVLRALERGEADVARIEAALAQVEPLVLRLRVALEVIRRGPVPAQFFAAVRRVRAEITAFRVSAAR